MASRGRGGKKKGSHKGHTRHFTSAEEILRQNEEISRQKEADADNESSDEKEGGGGGGRTVKINTGANKEKKISDAEDSSEEESSSDDDTGISNPNRIKGQGKLKKMKDLDSLTIGDGASPASGSKSAALNRKEREALEAERKKQEYLKRHARGETEEAQKDLARLAVIRKQREEAAKKLEQEKKAKEVAKVQAKGGFAKDNTASSK